MESPLIESINQLNILEISILGAFGIMAAYFFLSHQVEALMFMVVLGASLMGTTLPVVSDIGSLVRWISILLLLLSGILFSRIKMGIGMLLFWGYVFWGLLFLFRAYSITWQFQKAILLIIVTIGVPIAYSNQTYIRFYKTLILVAIIGTIFALINFVNLPNHLNEAMRFMGYSKSAPFFANILGGLLPFTYWCIWNVRRNSIKFICGFGFLIGFVGLILSGQRAGTVAGVIGIIPLILITIKNKKNILLFLLVVILLVSVFSVLALQSNNRLNFLLTRYSLDYGLSNRELLWQIAISEIANNPLLGRGIGAAEGLVPSSFHNTYLEVWFNAGLIGLILFVTAQLYFIYRTILLISKVKDIKARSILALTLGYIAGFIVLCNFESTGGGASNANLIIYLFLGVLVSSNVLIKTDDRHNIPINKRLKVLA